MPKGRGILTGYDRIVDYQQQSVTKLHMEKFFNAKAETLWCCHIRFEVRFLTSVRYSKRHDSARGHLNSTTFRARVQQTQRVDRIARDKLKPQKSRLHKNENEKRELASQKPTRGRCRGSRPSSPLKANRAASTKMLDMLLF